MEQEIAAFEPRLKEVLYRCLEQIRATKAALFLNVSEKRFDLVTSYGFREIEPKHFTTSDDLIDRMIVRRTPFFLNSLTEDPRFSQMLFSAGTTRMLIAPIYSRGRLIGFVDMRDKAAKQPFGAQDLLDAQKIADEFLEVFAEKNLFGQQKSAADPVRQRPVEEVSGELSNARAAIDESKRAIGRGVLKPRRAGETLTEEQVNAGAVILPAFLSLPGVLFAALSSFGRYSGFQKIASSAEFRQDASAKFEARLRSWLQKRGEYEGLASSFMAFPFGKAPVPIDANRLSTILSAPLKVHIPGVVISVGFEAAPVAQTRRALAGLLKASERVLRQALAEELLAETLLKVAERLVEPDYTHFTVLLSHCRRVSEMAAQFASYVGLSQGEVDQVRIAGLVHDVGMRLLDYHTLYRKATLTAEETRILREHPTVGAALIAETALGPAIANIVLAHHERPDGTGYPNGLRGEGIPMLSRILHICECFDAMTAVDSYQTAIPQPTALARIQRVAGSQLDGDLVEKFVEMLSGSKQAVRV